MNKQFKTILRNSSETATIYNFYIHNCKISKISQPIFSNAHSQTHVHSMENFELLAEGSTVLVLQIFRIQLKELTVLTTHNSCAMIDVYINSLGKITSTWSRMNAINYNEIYIYLKAVVVFIIFKQQLFQNDYFGVSY